MEMRYADKPYDSVWNVEGSTPVKAVVKCVLVIDVIKLVMKLYIIASDSTTNDYLSHFNLLPRIGTVIVTLY